MKKIFRLSLLFASIVSLTSCSFFDYFFSNDEGGNSQYESFNIEPLSLDDSVKIIAPKYTYKDYAQNSAFAISSSPSVGTSNLLVIPVWFTDSSNYISYSSRENVRDDIKKAYFGSEKETGWNSVSTYYYKDSFGKLNITGTVSSWYECNKSSSYYYQENSSGTKTGSLVKDAVKWYKTTTGASNLRNFDKDGDGYLDGVMLIYAAPDYVRLGNDEYDNLWAYCFWIQNPGLKDVINPGPNAFFWASYDFMYSGLKARSRTGKSSYGSGDNSHTNVDAHTYVHEMGHVLGLTDYYDYSAKTIPAGGFSMQDMNIGAHDPFSRLSLGWIRAYVPTESITIDLRPMEATGDVILLSPTMWNGSPFDEYILVEYYVRDGLNKLDSTYSYGGYTTGSSRPGVRLWHVDARLFSYSDFDTGSGKLTTNPKDGSVVLANSNTPYSKAFSDYCSNLAGSYDYRLNYYIRNDETANYNSKDFQSSSNIFSANSSFSMTRYSSQFVNGSKLNDGKSLGWSISIQDIDTTHASVKLTKI